ncbi:MAG: tripartite tricarboxylate transporter TctB family protein [Pseudomonadota bacterium]
MAGGLRESVLVQLTLLAVACALYWSTLGQTFSDVGSAHSPMFFPRIILVLWIGLSCIALVNALREPTDTERPHSLIRLGVLVGAVVVYSNVITTYGFFLSSAVLAAVALPLFGIRQPLVVLAYAVIVPGSLVGLFNHMLGMPLPTSPFTYLF